MRPKEKNTPKDSVQFEKHQPERQRAVGSYLFCNGGCCCCCCCLHSLGGLIGGMVASATTESQSTGSVLKCYWLSLLFSAGAVVLFTLGSCGALIGAVGAAFFLPAAQLFASLVTLIWIKNRATAFPDQKASLRLLGYITLYSFLAAVAGGFIMLLCFKTLH